MARTIIRIVGDKENSPIELREDGGMFDLVQDGEIVEFSPEQLDHFANDLQKAIKFGNIKLPAY